MSFITTIIPNTQILRLAKDKDNIKISFPTKKDVINFEFNTIEEDIFINIEIEKMNIDIKNKNEFRLNTTVSKNKNRLAYKIKWDLKTHKKKNQSKSDYYQ